MFSWICITDIIIAMNTKKLKVLLFILIIVIVVFTAITYLLFKSNASTKQEVFNLQGQCAQRAKSFMSANDPTAGYTNAYHSNDNKCFIELTHNLANNQVGGYNYTSDIWDVDAGSNGKIYAQINIYIPKGQNEFNYSAGEVELCSVGQTRCTSLDQFNSLVKDAYGIEVN